MGEVYTENQIEKAFYSQFDKQKAKVLKPIIDKWWKEFKTILETQNPGLTKSDMAFIAFHEVVTTIYAPILKAHLEEEVG